MWMAFSIGEEGRQPSFNSDKILSSSNIDVQIARFSFIKLANSFFYQFITTFAPPPHFLLPFQQLDFFSRDKMIIRDHHFWTNSQDPMYVYVKIVRDQGVDIDSKPGRVTRGNFHWNESTSKSVTVKIIFSKILKFEVQRILFCKSFQCFLRTKKKNAEQDGRWAS